MRLGKKQSQYAMYAVFNTSYDSLKSWLLGGITLTLGLVLSVGTQINHRTD
jgi:hypothetical protein